MSGELAAVPRICSLSVLRAFEPVFAPALDAAVERDFEPAVEPDFDPAFELAVERAFDPAFEFAVERDFEPAFERELREPDELDRPPDLLRSAITEQRYRGTHPVFHRQPADRANR
jgi:hypothetical protein